MKKLFALSLMGSSLLFSTQHAKADWDFWAVDYSGDSSVGNRIYTCVSATGICTQRSTKLFENNGWQTANSYVDDDNNLVIYGAGGTLHSYDLDTDTWTDTGTGWTGNYQKVFERPDIVKNSDGSVTVGQGASVISIDEEGIEQNGEDLLKKKSNGEIHLGKNSWITKEENGKQNVYAKDADGNAIPINYINGTDLQINGKSVQGQIDTNASNIKNLGEGISSSTALTAALTALPQTSKESKISCGVGTGAFSSKYAIGFGCASKVNERVDLNAGGSYVFGGSKSYGSGTLDSGVMKAGFVFKLGKLNKPSQISMKEKEEFKKEISDLKENNKNIIAQNNALLARLERLEKIAIGDLKSKDVAVYPVK